jgi:hypothetical protein
MGTLNRNQIRSNRNLLIGVGSAGLIIGFSAWFVPPFIMNKPQYRIARYSLLGVGLLGGISAIICGSQLSKNRIIYQSLDKQEISIYLTSLASGQYLSETLIKRDTEKILTPALTPPLTEVLTPEVTTEQGFQNLLTEVAAAINDSKSDSFIIENILKMKGRHYAEGKEMLAEIKEDLGVGV